MISIGAINILVMYIDIIFPHIHKQSINVTIFPITSNIEKNAITPSISLSMPSGLEKNIFAISPGVIL